MEAESSPRSRPRLAEMVISYVKSIRSVEADKGGRMTANARDNSVASTEHRVLYLFESDVVLGQLFLMSTWALSCSARSVNAAAVLS